MVSVTGFPKIKRFEKQQSTTGGQCQQAGASKPEQASRHKQGHSVMAQQHVSMAAAFVPWRYG